MIIDSRAFEERMVPEDLHSRDGELDALATALKPAIRGAEPMPAFCFGPSGSGKTVSTRYVCRQLDREGVRTAYINCWRAYRTTDFLEAVFDELGGMLRARYHRSIPTSDLLARLRQGLDGQAVIIVDEADVLEDISILRQINAVPELTPVVIANREEDLFARFDGAGGDLGAGVRVPFDRYDTPVVADILAARAEHGLTRDAWDRDLLTTVADAAAGDARLAIQTLRVAAESCSSAPITSTDVESAVPTARAQIKRRAFSSLDAKLQALVKIVAEADGGEIAPTPLYEAFEKRVEDAPSRRTIRNWLDDLSHYNLIDRHGEKAGRRYALDDELREALFARADF